MEDGKELIEMIKLKISYENEKELKQFLSLIKHQTKKVKLSKNEQGHYKKAYVTLKDFK